MGNRLNDLISRQAAIDAVGKESQVDGAYGYMDTKSIVDLLNDLPSVQPGIIRCRDCIYYRQEIDMCDEPYSTAHNVVHEDDYCSKAERKTDGRLNQQTGGD